MPRSGVVRLAGPGLVVRGGPECGSGWTRGRHACSVSANRAGAQNFWYVQPDCVNNRPVNPGGARGWPCANTDLCLATLLKTAVFVPFFLTRNAFIKTWNRCTFFASTSNGRLFRGALQLCLSNRHEPNECGKGTLAKWASVEQWYAVRLYVKYKNYKCKWKWNHLNP